MSPDELLVLLDVTSNRYSPPWGGEILDGLTSDSITRHDILLAAIALPLLVAGALGALLPVGMSLALGAGSVPATGSMGYALFYRPPGQNTDA